MSTALLSPTVETAPVHTPATADAALPAQAAPSLPAAADVREARTANPATSAFLAQHGLNWEVHRVTMVTTGIRQPEPDPVSGVPVPLAEVGAQPVPASYAIRRSDDATILGVVGPKYTPAQNAFVVDALQTAGFFTDRTVRHAGPMDDGRSIIIQLGDNTEFATPSGGKAPTLDLNIRNGHVGQYNLQVRPMIRLPDGGQVPLFTSSKLVRGWSIRHTRGLPGAVRDLSEMWTKTKGMVTDATDAIASLGGMEIGKTEYRAIILAAMNRTIDGTDENIRLRTEKFCAAFEAHTLSTGKDPRTLLDLADSVSAYVDHARPVRARHGYDQETLRRESSLIGAGAKFKEALMDELIHMLSAEQPTFPAA